MNVSRNNYSTFFKLVTYSIIEIQPFLLAIYFLFTEKVGGLVFAKSENKLYIPLKYKFNGKFRSFMNSFNGWYVGGEI